MKRNFWQKLRKPFFVLAPMADVTDPVFRKVILKCGKPDVMYTEFVSCDGLMSEGREKLLHHLEFNKKERPIVVQFFGSRPENFAACAKLAVELGFDGIDINMGCPDRSVEKQGAGAALIKNPKLAREIIRATKKGAESAGRQIPVSVKTRAGYNKDEIDTWIPELLAEKPDALIVHARTRKEMSKVDADWGRIRRVVEMAKGTGTVIIGNGDIDSLEEGREKALETGCDGIMIGRGIFKNPFLFREGRGITRNVTQNHAKDIRRQLGLAAEHTKMFNKFYGNTKSFAAMRKFYKMYANGFDGAKELRTKIMKADSAEEAIGLLEKARSSLLVARLSKINVRDAGRDKT